MWPRMGGGAAYRAGADGTPSQPADVRREEDRNATMKPTEQDSSTHLAAADFERFLQTGTIPADFFKDLLDVESVFIPAGITRIGASAFEGILEKWCSSHAHGMFGCVWQSCYVQRSGALTRPIVRRRSALTFVLTDRTPPPPHHRPFRMQEDRHCHVPIDAHAHWRLCLLGLYEHAQGNYSCVGRGDWRASLRQLLEC